jgi:hypothetical protein
LYRVLSQLYGWTPRQIGELTICQIDAYLTDPVKAGKTRKVSLAEARAIGLIR